MLFPPNKPPVVDWLALAVLLAPNKPPLVFVLVAPNPPAVFVPKVFVAVLVAPPNRPPVAGLLAWVFPPKRPPVVLFPPKELFAPPNPVPVFVPNPVAAGCVVLVDPNKPPAGLLALPNSPPEALLLLVAPKADVPVPPNPVEVLVAVLLVLAPKSPPVVFVVLVFPKPDVC